MLIIVIVVTWSRAMLSVRLISYTSQSECSLRVCSVWFQ